jgi:hypothetical protein
MTIDMSAGVPAPHFIDIKLEKKAETEGTEPIEASEESEDSKLDMSRQDTAKKRSTREVADEARTPLAIYNARGKIRSEKPS